MKKRKEKTCFFLSNGIQHVDYRDTHILHKFLDAHGRILSRKRTGLCAKYHRKVTTAIKQARFMALLPYVRQ